MIKLFEMFAGYGGASFALKKANIDFECIGISEIDKFAVQCYNNNFPNVKNYGDCTKINTTELPDFDLLTGGFPCQDVSIAGKRDLSKGRTNLYQEILRIAKDKRPKYMLLENVKGLLSMGEDRKLINIIVNDLISIGYGVAWKVLNSKDFGIPQNRERVWFVCKLGGFSFGEFKFPNEEPLKLLLKDILEDEVDNKYYLKQEQTERLLKGMENKNRSKLGVLQKKEVSDTLLQNDYKNPKCVYEMSNRVYNPNGVAPTLTKVSGGNQEKKILYNQVIRKLTPKECFRLMGFLNDEINLDGISDSQKYRLAGNGWEITVASKIFKNLLKQKVYK